jgi:hypothetical protein
MTRKALLCTATGVLALALACSKTSPAPTSPSSATPATAGAAADGSTLKAPAPSIVSPTGGVVSDDPTTLTANTVKGTYDPSIQLSYNFQVRSGSTVVAQDTVGPTTGSTVSFAPTGLDFEVNYTWRVQATYQGASGPWSADASFKTPAGAYIRGAEIRDPLTGGKTVGTLEGGATLTSDGVFLPEHESHVTYALPQTLTAGEFSMMIKGINPSQMRGAKSKAFSMEEGFGDITTNDYRATIDLRGRAYPTPGQVRFRFITGDARSRVFDAGPVNPSWDPSRWYFWRFSWQTGRATLEIHADSETGPLTAQISTGTGSHEYRPSPHVLYLGQPIGRGGDDDATTTGLTYKDVWVSANPRPHFSS